MAHEEARSAGGCVGIFWGVPIAAGSKTFVIVTDQTALDEAEAYDRFLTHPRGHYEVWEAWQRLGPAGLKRRGLPEAIAWNEYEEFPRGRIVYDTTAERYAVYADRRLQADEPMAAIVEAFGLTHSAYSVASDAHYR